MPLIHHCITGNRNSFLLVAIGIVLLMADYGLAMRQQAVAARGQLRCGDRPASGVKVKLWDEDDGPDPDDMLDEAFTDMSGSFQLRGSTRELTNIDPVLKIYHDCNDGIMPGQRKVKLRIPNQYITNGGLARRTFDVGVLNLETVFAGEERDLI
uniref:Transthyretin-like family protein n=1 Tax=Globodera rostochiensis TaxID=31243 RepID=A0A914HG85_GLORO